MTRSIFDPDGGVTERSGSTFLGPEGPNASHMPPSQTDGEVEGEGGMTAEEVDRADDTPAPFTPDADEAARRLGEMTNP